MSKKFVLPFIEPKQSKKEDFENYNFVKEGRKSRNSFKDTLPASSKEEVHILLIKLDAYFFCSNLLFRQDDLRS